MIGDPFLQALIGYEVYKALCKKRKCKPLSTRPSKRLIDGSPWSRDLREGWHNGRPMVAINQTGWDGKYPIFDGVKATEEEYMACKDIWETSEARVYVDCLSEAEPYWITVRVNHGDPRGTK